MYLGLGLRLGSGTFAGYDADAAAYFDRAGVTDATAKQQINAFVVGVKALGLWNNMVCWPLRSAQNKGSGTTAYSLGGYGVYNGTLSSSGIWSSAGLSLVAETNSMNCGLNLGAYPDSVVVVTNLTTNPGNNLPFFTTAGVNVNGRQFVIATTTVANYDAVAAFRDTWATRASNDLYTDTGYGVVTGIRYLSCRPQSNTTLNASGNNNFWTDSMTGWAASSAGPLYVKGYQGNQTVSFFSYFNTAISNSLDTSFRSLYKTTLGTGLGLP